jgi:enamine deaminase RidA (YjgF/YER057c/UK114 family)
MLVKRNPTSAPPSFSAYSLAVEAPPGARWLHVSGQVGVTPDGRLAEGARGQMEQIWRNLLAILADAAMGPEDLVKVTAFLTRPEDTALYRETRDAALDGAEPASTLVVVQALAHPDWLVEIEAVAAKAG